MATSVQSPSSMYGPHSTDEDFSKKQYEDEPWMDWALNPRRKPLFHELANNLKAGITVALVNVPLSISLAVAAGASPDQGIVTAFWAGLVCAIFSSSHFNVVGPTGALSGMLAVISHKHGPGILPYVSMLAGVILFLFFLLRVDRYMRYFCTPVAHGFSVGVAVIIAVAQFPAAFGLTKLRPKDNIGDKISEIVLHLPEARTNDTLLFFANILPLLFLIHRWERIPWPIIFAVVGIVIGYNSAAGTFVLLNEQFRNLRLDLWAPVNFKGSLAVGAPDVLVYGFGIAIVSLLETLISAQISNQMAQDNSNLNYDTRRESFGLALANVVTGWFGGFPATATLARSSLNVKSGAWSRISSIINVVATALLASVFLRWFEYIPMPTLAALLIVVACRLVNFTELSELRLSDTPGTYAFIVTAATCIMTDTFLGLMVGAVISVFFNLMHVGIIGLEVHEADSRGDVIAVVQSAMVFVNTNELKDAFYEVIRVHRYGRRITIVLDDVTHIDFDGARAFHDVIETFHRHQWQVRLTGTKHLHRQLTACKAFAMLNPIQDSQEI